MDENRNEIAVRQQLETKLSPGEELLSYTSGVITGDVNFDPINLGLTSERVILMLIKKKKILSIWRENIQHIKWAGLWSRLKIKFQKTEIDIAFHKSYWKKRAKDMAAFNSQPSLSTNNHDITINNQRHLQQGETYMELGYIDYAQQELDKIQSVSGSIPAEIEALSKQVGEKRLSLRVGASFLFANLVIGILLTGLVLIQGNASPSYTAIAVGLLVPVFIDSMIGVNLWKGHARQWQTWAVYRAAIGLVLFGLAYLAQGDFLDFFLQAAFCGSLLVILTGRSGRMRTWIAIGIYVIGYIGLLLFTFVISFLAALVSG